MSNTSAFIINQEYQASGANYVVLINGQLNQNTSTLLHGILSSNTSNDLTVVATSPSVQLERILTSYENISLQYEDLELEDFRTIDRVIVVGAVGFETIQLADYSGVPVSYYLDQTSPIISISGDFAKVA